MQNVLIFWGGIKRLLARWMSMLDRMKMAETLSVMTSKLSFWEVLLQVCSSITMLSVFSLSYETPSRFPFFIMAFRVLRLASHVNLLFPCTLDRHLMQQEGYLLKLSYLPRSPCVSSSSARATAQYSRRLTSILSQFVYLQPMTMSTIWQQMQKMLQKKMRAMPPQPMRQYWSSWDWVMAASLEQRARLQMSKQKQNKKIKKREIQSRSRQMFRQPAWKGQVSRKRNISKAWMASRQEMLPQGQPWNRGMLASIRAVLRQPTTWQLQGRRRWQQFQPDSVGYSAKRMSLRKQLNFSTQSSNLGELRCVEAQGSTWQKMMVWQAVKYTTTKIVNTRERVLMVERGWDPYSTHYSIMLRAKQNSEIQWILWMVLKMMLLVFTVRLCLLSQHLATNNTNQHSTIMPENMQLSMRAQEVWPVRVSLHSADVEESSRACWLMIWEESLETTYLVRVPSYSHLGTSKQMKLDQKRAPSYMFSAGTLLQTTTVELNCAPGKINANTPVFLISCAHFCPNPQFTLSFVACRSSTALLSHLFISGITSRPHTWVSVSKYTLGFIQLPSTDVMVVDCSIGVTVKLTLEKKMGSVEQSSIQQEQSSIL